MTQARGKFDTLSNALLSRYASTGDYTYVIRIAASSSLLRQSTRLYLESYLVLGIARVKRTELSRRRDRSLENDFLFLRDATNKYLPLRREKRA